MLESVRMKGIFAELESKQAELKKSALEHTQDFGSLEAMIARYQEVEDMVEQQECLEKLKPVLVEAIAQAEREEAAVARQSNKERLDKEIKKVTTALHKVQSCSPEQTALLQKLSQLKKEMNKNG